MKLLQPFVPEPLQSPQPQPVALKNPEQVLAQKEQFAELFYRSGDAFASALVIFGDANAGHALRIAADWPVDAEVKTFLASLKKAEEEGELSFVATKADQAKLAWKMANNGAWVQENRVKALELCAKITGAIERPATTINNNNNNVQVNRVLIVKDHGTDDEWERKAVQQQERLKREVIEHAA